MPVKILVPEIGESVVEATVGRWLKKEGERVAAGEIVVELETDKVNMQVGAEREGTLTRIEKKEGEDVKVGDVLGVIMESAESKSVEKPPVKTAPAESANPEEKTTAPAARVVAQPAPQNGGGATPVAKRFAEEQGVDLARVATTVPRARVTKEDVEKYLEEQHAKATPPLPQGSETVHVATRPVPVARRADREERVRMSRRRRTIAQRMVEAHQTAAMLTSFNEIDLSAVIDLRRRRRESFKQEHGVDLGFMSFFVKASIGALKAFPQLNAEIQGDEIVLKHYYDIGIAVGAAEGLVVPVLHDADRMSFTEIERAIEEFVQKTKDGTLAIEDLRGGTFTITNGGVFGSLLSTPILNTPQVGILGLHKIEERPIALNGQVVIRSMMYVALSYDHRLVDGREAVQFLALVKKLVEEPESLLLEG